MLSTDKILFMQTLSEILCEIIKKVLRVFGFRKSIYLRPLWKPVNNEANGQIMRKAPVCWLAKQIIWFAVAIALFAPLSYAGEIAEKYDLHIRGKTLEQSLDEMYRQTGISQLYSHDLAKTEVINSVYGRYSIDEALAIMLQGTGLHGGLTQGGVVVISRVKETSSARPKGETMTNNKTSEKNSQKEKINRKKLKQSFLAGVSALILGTAQSPALAQDNTGSEQINGSSAISATGIITGRVTYSGTNAPLVGAIVNLDNINLTAVTNERGEYRFAAAPVGTHNISVDYLGTEAKSETVSVRPNTKTVKNFALGKIKDEVIVTSQRSARMQALNQQRSADNNSTVVSSDFMGNFPAETIAESLRRVSGITFGRDDATGEGTNLTVRGFNSEAITVQLNGTNLEGTGINRGIDLSGFLTENIAKVTIQKSRLPSHEANATGGLVQIETKSGLDYGDKYLSTSIERESTMASDFGKEMQASILGAYKISENFGVTASLQYRDTNRDNFDLSQQREFFSVLPDGVSFSFRTPAQDYPFFDGMEPLSTGVNYISRQRDTADITGSLGFAYDLADHTRLKLDISHIRADTELSSANSTLSFLTRYTNMPIQELGGEVRRRSYIRSVRPTLGLLTDDTDRRTTSISFNGNTEFEKWGVKYNLGYTDAQTVSASTDARFSSNNFTGIDPLLDPASIVTSLDSGGNSRIVGGLVSTMGDNIPVLNLSQAGIDYLNNPDNYFLLFASEGERTDTNKALSGKLDITRNFNNETVEYIKIGGKFLQSKRVNGNRELSANVTPLTSYFRIFGRNTSLSDLSSGGITGLDLSLIGGPRGVTSLTRGGFGEIIGNVQNLLEDDPNTPENEERFRVVDRTTNPIENAGSVSSLTIEELNLAGYVEGKVKFGDFSLVGGVRYERDDRNGNTISTHSILLPDGTRVQRAELVNLGLIDFYDTGGVNETWTPSVVASYRPTEQIVVRADYTRSTINPNIALLGRPTQIVLDLRPTSFFGPNARIREANPDLDPSVTDNFSANIEYYFADNPGVIKAGFFINKVSNNFTSVLSADEEADPEIIRSRILEMLAPYVEANPGVLVFPENTEYTLNRPTNGEGGTLFGVELELIKQLDFLPQSFPGFMEDITVSGNLTYTTSDFETLENAFNEDGERVTLKLNRPFTGQSKWAGNASVIYEKDNVFASLIYSYQSASAFDYDEFGLNTILPAYSTLDARVQYIINDSPIGERIILFAEGDDLLKSGKTADIRRTINPLFSDNATNFDYPSSVQFNGGRTVTVGIKFNF